MSDVSDLRMLLWGSNSPSVSPSSLLVSAILTVNLASTKPFQDSAIYITNCVARQLLTPTALAAKWPAA